MEYREGTIGRVFSVRFDEGDLFLEELLQLIAKENILPILFSKGIC